MENNLENKTGAENLEKSSPPEQKKKKIKTSQAVTIIVIIILLLIPAIYLGYKFFNLGKESADQTTQSPGDGNPSNPGTSGNGTTGGGENSVDNPPGESNPPDGEEPPVIGPDGCTLDAQFLSHVTIPDGTNLLANSTFKKTWRVQNNGTCDWEAGTKLTLISGDDFCDADSAVILPLMSDFTQDISLDCTAPSGAGTYESVWRIKNPSGEVYGDEFPIEINVYTLEALEDMPEGEAKPRLDLSRLGDSSKLTGKNLGSLFPWVEQVDSLVAVEAGKTGEVIAVCPEGTTVIGGGFAVEDMIVYYSRQYNPPYKPSENKWISAAKNNTTGSHWLHSYAVCLHNKELTSKLYWYWNDVGAHNYSDNAVGCNFHTEEVVSGGFNSDDPDAVKILDNYKNDEGDWYTRFSNSSGSSKTYDTYSTCLSGADFTVEIRHGQGFIPAHGTGSATASCESGEIVAGGGFEVLGGTEVYISSKAGGNNAWQIFARNNNDSEKMIAVYATCLSFH